MAATSETGRKRRLAIGGGLVILLAAAASAALSLFPMSEPAVAAAPAARGEVVGRVIATGPVQPSQDTDLTARINGVLEQFDPKEGDRLKKGQVVATISRTAYETALADAESRAAAQEASLAQLERRDKLSDEQAAIRLAAAQEKLDLAKSQLTDRQTAAGRAITEAAYGINKVSLQLKRAPVDDPLKNELTHAQQLLQNAQADLDRLGQADNPARLQVALAEADLKDARASIEATAVLPEELSAARSALTAAREAVVRAKEDLAATTITAPADSTVLQVFVRQGAGVQPGVRLVTVAAPDKATVMANVDESDINKVEIGQSVRITTPNIPGLELKGSVTRVMPRATKDNTNTTVIQVEVEFANEGGRLRPGMNADVEIAVAHKQGVLRLPLSQLRGKSDDRYVWVAENGTARRRAVVIGVRDAEWAEVVSGVKEGDQVLTGPDSVLKELREGQAIKVGGNG